MEFEFAALDGCSRVVVVVTEGAKGTGGGGRVGRGVGGYFGADRVAGQLLLPV